jgi:NAD(P)-dependent dehydrogenase (short-subunit alcohol dehydrogenase family)
MTGHLGTVVIFGASSGIGLATAATAASLGAEVTLIARSREKLEQALKTVTGSARALPVDMLDREAVDLATAELGPVDHLVFTAAGDEYALFDRIADVRDEQVERSFDKLRGLVNVTRALVPRLRARGSITILSGAGAVKPPVGTSLAAAANGSVVSFAKALALELQPIRVNVVMPGVVDTPRHGPAREAVLASAESALPARRFGKPDEIAEAIVFLMTNPYVTGHTLVIDGGYLAGS